MPNKRIMLIYDYFDPAIQAGGPISSCRNLLHYFKLEYSFFIYTSNKEMDGSRLEVSPDEWVDYSGAAKILYGDKQWSPTGLINAIKEVKPDILYLNGIYSFTGVIVPLLMSRFTQRGLKVVVVPRGMLQQNALGIKVLKKRVYLIFFRWLVGYPNIFWQVTSEQEKDELQQVIPGISARNIKLVGNVPRTDLNYSPQLPNQDVLRLLTIALISPMKNILQVIRALANIKFNVIYAIYGPIKDPQYWQDCLNAVATLPSNVSIEYHGIADRQLVPEVLSQCDIYIQPSRSENFGHAIFEALSVGRPVITSYNTPWVDLEENNAGWNVEGDDESALHRVITEARGLQASAYEVWSEAARRLSEEYMLSGDFDRKYGELFSSLSE